MKYLLATIVLTVALSGCSSNNSTKNSASESSPTSLYQSARQQLQSGNYRAAITELESLDNRYPYGPYSQQVQMDLIYAYYKTNDLALALAAIDRFIRLNPTHANIDYILYMRGLTNMGLDDNSLQRFFGVNRADRDPQYAKVAFTDFNQLTRNYPKSTYANDAKLRMQYLQNRLAMYDLSVVQFYTKRGAYVAVINRVEEMLTNYPDSEATRKALPFMENAYRKLQLNDLADKISEIIRLNA